MASVRLAQAGPAQTGGIRPAPEFSTLKLSDLAAGDRRLEAAVYLSEGSAVRRAIARCSLPTKVLGNVATIWQPGRDVSVQVGPEHGKPYLAATQVFDIWPTPRKRVVARKNRDLGSLYVRPNWLLVTCSGTVGRVIRGYTAHAGCAISSDLLRVEVSESVLRSYIYVFMRSRLGRAMMEGSQYGSIIKHLRPAHLAELRIPMLSRARQEIIHSEVQKVYGLRDEAYQLDMNARATYAAQMSDRPGLRYEVGYSISANDFFKGRRRLEAGAYSPKAQYVAEAYRRNALSVATIGQLARVFLPNRFTRIYGDEGWPYLDSEPVFKVNPGLSKHLTSATNIVFDDYMVHRGCLLMARSGQIYGINGQAILANEWHEGKIITEHIIRITPTEGKIRAGYLQTTLSHPTLGKPLVVSRAFGTSVPELAPEDIEQLEVPRLHRAIEDEIAEAAERASALRCEADARENRVVRTFESTLADVLSTARGVPNE